MGDVSWFLRVMRFGSSSRFWFKVGVIVAFGFLNRCCFFSYFFVSAVLLCYFSSACIA
jgi:hypothetical protein